ncbi:MAG: hypothetical protein KDK36_19150 [Leptospiraceae bacterium]|nr:hypothetical protein [Leptospiraceae bacterium]
MKPILIILFTIFYSCTSGPLDLLKRNPKVFKELIKDYHTASEDKFGEEVLLKFNNDQNKSIEGKISGIDTASCSWFLDRKRKDSKEDIASLKKINLYCGGNYFTIVFNNMITPEKINYNGIYGGQFSRFKKGIVLEATCSFTTINKEGVEEASPDDKDSNVECFPYPHDIDKYTKDREREVARGYFLYSDTSEELQKIFDSAKEQEQNDALIEFIMKEFNNDFKRKNQKSSSSIIGRDVQFSSGEFIDFKEVPITNSRGKELQKKVETLLETDLSKKENKDNLKEAIEDLVNCNEKCSSKEKENIGYFEIKSKVANRNIIIIKKFKSTADLLNYKRFDFYTIDGKLSYIDFSEKGEIERIVLD